MAAARLVMILWDRLQFRSPLVSNAAAARMAAVRKISLWNGYSQS